MVPDARCALWAASRVGETSLESEQLNRSMLALLDECGLWIVW